MQSIFPNEYEFMSIGSVTTNTYLQGDSSDYLIFVFELDQEYLYIERRAYTFIDVLGQVGGFMGILIPLGSVLVKIISNNIYWMTLINTFYDTESSLLNNPNMNMIHPIDQRDLSQRVPTKSEFWRSDIPEEQKYADEAIQNDDKNESVETNRFEALNKLSKKLNRRNKIEFNWSDLLSTIIWK